MPSSRRFAITGPCAVIVTCATWSNSPHTVPRSPLPPPVVASVMYWWFLR
jgi:hypothetical protein